jgi:hypothetical protein
MIRGIVIMAKRKSKIKLSKAEQLDKDLNKWLRKKDDAINQLIKAMGKLRELWRTEARLNRRERTPDVSVAEIEHEMRQAHKRIARKRTVSDVTNIPVSELPIADVLVDDHKKLLVTRTRKRKAEAVV